jgi:hypothetical protein
MQAPDGLAPGGRVHQARDRTSGVPHPDAALIAANALPDVFQPSLASFHGELGVGEQCAGHGHHIRAALREHPLRLDRFEDPAHRHDRDR